MQKRRSESETEKALEEPRRKNKRTMSSSRNVERPIQASGSSPDGVTPLPLQTIHRVMPELPPGMEVTRVMSPNIESSLTLALREERALAVQQSPSDVRAQCEWCNRLAVPPVRCSDCQIIGHHACLRIVDIEGYPFCAVCVPRVRERLAQFRTAEQRDRWRQLIARQREFSESAVVAATGAMTALGTVATGVGAAAVAGSIALARSVAQTAHASASAALETSRRLAPVVDGHMVAVPQSADTVFEEVLGDVIEEGTRVSDGQVGDTVDPGVSALQLPASAPSPASASSVVAPVRSDIASPASGVILFVVHVTCWLIGWLPSRWHHSWTARVLTVRL